MKFLIDENVNVAVVDPLRVTFIGHSFTTVREQRWLGLKDTPLFEAMSAERFDVLVTRDRDQLTDPSERTALRDHGLHWVGVKPPKFPGIKGLALETAALVAGLPYVLEGLPFPGPTAFHVRGLPSEPSQRLKSEPL